VQLYYKIIIKVKIYLMMAAYYRLSFL
jgi:hypothetical protein